MTKQYKLVIFDWEGTLGDTLGQILTQVREEAAKLGFGQFDEAKARQYVGLGLVRAVQKLFPHLDTQKQEALLEAVSRAMITRHNDVFLLPGARALVSSLNEAGVFLAVATNKGEASLKRALQASEMDSLIQVTRCAGSVPPKPCPQMLEEILDVFALHPEQAVMIGDSADDMAMAAAIGMDALGVDFYGGGSQPLKQAGALAVYEDYASLADFLHSHI